MFMFVVKVDVWLKFLDVVFMVICKKGYFVMMVDEFCVVVGVMKGVFFYYFKSKDEFGVVVVDYWLEMMGGMFVVVFYYELVDLFECVFVYLELWKVLLVGEVVEFICVVGIMV